MTYLFTITYNLIFVCNYCVNNFIYYHVDLHFLHKFEVFCFQMKKLKGDQGHKFH